MLNPHPALAELRHRIRFLESPDVREDDVLPLGADAIDTHLRARGLQVGALHEAFGAAEEGFAPEPTLFVVGILARQRRPVLWCLEKRDLFAPGPRIRWRFSPRAPSALALSLCACCLSASFEVHGICRLP
jgi:hypothetical protein